MSDKRNWLPKRDPWAPADYDPDVTAAVRAFFGGHAGQSQQIIVRDWIMYLTAATEQFADLSFRPGADGQRASDFAEGKRFVGLQLRKMLRSELDPKAPAPVLSRAERQKTKRQEVTDHGKAKRARRK